MHCRARALPTVLAVLAGAAASCGGSDAPRDLVVVTFDTTRADALGCYGSPLGLTPVLDALARRGVLFERAYAPMPQTLPSHATLFTGLEPREHGALENAYVLPPEVETLGEGLAQRGYRTGGFVGALVLAADTGIAQGLQAFDEPADGRARRRADEVTSAALAWCATLPRDAPLFLWVHYYDPHDPYPPDSAQRGPSSEDVRAWLRTRRGEYGGPRVRFAEDLVERWRAYGAELRFADASMGALLAGLAEQGRGDATVVVAGDHGEGHAEHGELGHGLHLFEELVRVPLIVAAPSLAPRRVTTPVPLVGLAGSLRALLEHGPVEDDPLGLLEGREPAPVPIFLERPHYSRERLQQRAGGRGATWGPSTAVVAGGDKLLLAPDAAPALFDLSADPAELHDRAPARPERAHELEALLRRWMERHPSAPPGAGADASPARLEALRALGYVGDH